MLRRLFEQYSITYWWREKYEYLVGEYKDLDERYREATAKILQMGIDIAAMNDVIQSQKNLIMVLEEGRVKMASQSFTTTEQENVEIASAPADLCN